MWAEDRQRLSSDIAPASIWGGCALCIMSLATNKIASPYKAHIEAHL